MPPGRGPRRPPASRYAPAPYPFPPPLPLGFSVSTAAVSTPGQPPASIKMNYLILNLVIFNRIISEIIYTPASALLPFPVTPLCLLPTLSPIRFTIKLTATYLVYQPRTFLLALSLLISTLYFLCRVEIFPPSSAPKNPQFDRNIAWPGKER